MYIHMFTLMYLDLSCPRGVVLLPGFCVVTEPEEVKRASFRR